ncbi:hypothetical protein EON82_17495, partial [bacterium]
MASIRRPLRRCPSRVLALATIAAAFSAAPKAQAQAYYWLGGNRDSWTDFTAWSGGRPGGSATTDIYFGRNAAGQQVIDNNGAVNNDLKSDFLLRSLNFYFQNWVLTGGSLLFTDKSSITARQSQVSISNNIALSGTLNATSVFNADTITLSGNISGAGSLVVEGTGTVILPDPQPFTSGNTFTGGTTVNGGRLIDYRARGNYVTNAELELRNSAGPGLFAYEMNYRGLITGTGSLTKSGQGALTLFSANSYRGYTTVAEGSLGIGIDNAIPTSTSLVINSGAVFQQNRNQTVATLAGAGRVRFYDDKTLTVNSAPGVATTFSGLIEGEGSFVKNGGGAMTFTGKNTYSGPTTINGGILVEYQPHGTYNNNAALQFLSQTDTTYAGLIQGTGSLIVSGTGTTTLTGTNTYTGGTVVNGGRLVEQNPHGTYTANADLEFRNASNLTYANAITGAGSFTKSGNGVLTLTGINRYVGTTTAAAGILRIGTNYAISDQSALTVNSGATFDVNGKSLTLKSLSGTGSLTLGASTGNLYVNNLSGTSFDGVISGEGRFVKSGVGTLILTGQNTNTGGTSVFDGRLLVYRPFGNYAVSSTLEARTATAQTYAGVISGEGSFVKSGAGTLTLTGTNTYTGGTTVNAGTLIDQNPHGPGYFVNELAGLELQNAGNQTYAGVISGLGTLVKSGAGTMTLTEANSYSGGTTVSAGRLIDQNPHGSYVTNAALEFANAGSLTHASPIAGTGSFTKSGAGTLTLSGASTYGGTTTVDTGTLRNGVANALPATTALTVNGTYDLGGFNQTLASLTGAGGVALSGGRSLTVNLGTSTSFAGIVSGAGSLVKGGAGTLTLTGANTYSGGTTIDAGRLIADRLNGNYLNNAALEYPGSGGATYSGAITGIGSFTRTSASGTLTLTGVNTYTGGTLATGGGRIIDQNPHGAYDAAVGATIEFQNAQGLTWSSPITGAGTFAKSGAGTLEITGGNTYTGRTIVREGRLIDANPHGSSYSVSGVLEFRTASDATYANPISGSGAFVKSGAGTLTLSSQNTYSGGTTVSAGRLIDQNPHGNYDNQAALEFNTTGTKSLSGIVSGAGSLTKSGAGTLTLSGSSAHAGGTTVDAGTLRVTGNLAGSVAVSAGATLDNAAPSGLALGSATLDGTVRTESLTR